jgi:hypothetical protein
MIVAMGTAYRPGRPTGDPWREKQMEFRGGLNPPVSESRGFVRAQPGMRMAQRWHPTGGLSTGNRDLGRPGGPGPRIRT